MRKLVSIQQIAEVASIEGADAIEKVRVQDWWCVAKRGEFKAGDLCVYHEIDALCPMNDTYAFLASRGTHKSELEDGTIVEGYRLKTIKLRGQISQGLALPISAFRTAAAFCVQVGQTDAATKVTTPSVMITRKVNDQAEGAFYYVGDDVTELLGVHKYEKPMNAQLRGLARGNFPSFLRKSDQERCQTLRREIWDAYVAGDKFQVTVKLDGSSMTVFAIDEVQAEKWGTDARFGVCSRNLELKETEDNAFWRMAVQNNISAFIGERNLMIQGELVAPNIQGNFEGVSQPQLHVYNMFDIEKQEWIAPNETWRMMPRGGMAMVFHVPVLHEAITLREMFPDATQDTIIQKLLDYADGPSSLGGSYREGVVFKRVDGKFSWKAISNRYLISEK